ncbi:unnamed protein product [Linum trigynum]|uniref:Uncharacterized protein n=1 Tax=Linum trigynum TaxID=586398 RepID=A0AAV2ETG9_9ROSI
MRKLLMVIGGEELEMVDAEDFQNGDVTAVLEGGEADGDNDEEADLWSKFSGSRPKLKRKTGGKSRRKEEEGSMTNAGKAGQSGLVSACEGILPDDRCHDLLPTSTTPTQRHSSVTLVSEYPEQQTSTNSIRVSEPQMLYLHVYSVKCWIPSFLGAFASRIVCFVA